MTRTRRPTIRWTSVTLLHLTLIAAVGYGTHQTLPAAMGLIWRWVFVIGITLTASLAADRPLGRLYGTNRNTACTNREPAALPTAATNTTTEPEMETAR